MTPSTTPLSTATERLLVSRERVRRALQRPGADPVPALAAAGARALLGPVSRQHPFVLVGGALALGGLLAWCRPWRSSAEPALAAATLLAQMLPPERAPSPSAGRQAAARASKKA